LADYPREYKRTGHLQPPQRWRRNLHHRAA
jgi:hypothetical protein